MSLKDIEKLKERVDKDPNSKLFVPLAEEYRKEGMIEEAIKVLLGGLEKQPGYMSARVALGKIYLEKGMPKEAQGEFENVIKAIPDNLYAQKKLADIYRDSGQRDLAIKSYRTVLKLNSMDEDAIHSLHELEDSEPEEQPAEEAVALEIPGEEPGGGEEEVAEEVVFTDSAHEQKAETAAHADDELSAFKDSLFGDKGHDEEEEIVSIDEEVEETSADTWDKKVGRVPLETVPEKISETAVNEEVPVAPEPMKVVQATPVPEAPQKDREDAIGDADRMISEGNYAGALNAYKRILSDNPDDRKVMQRMEELRACLKMTGKDKDMLIARLDAFLAGVKKGRDGFFGST